MPDFSCKQFTISQKNSALKLGTDAILLGALTNFKNPSNILDIGTGTGILALMMAQKYTCPIHAIDIDLGAYTDANYNIAQSIWKDRISCEHISLEEFTNNYTQHFDGIICNPPFFTNSLLSEQSNKNIARHTISLSPLSLMNCVKKIITKTGKFSIIIPISEKDLFLEDALKMDFYITSEIEISPYYNSQSNRIILEFSQTWVPLKKQSISIRESQHVYSKEFKEITKDFYL